MGSVLKPLSPAEKKLAEQNYYIVERFLLKKRLPFDEWFDVVIFRYLLTVQRWFKEPKLYKYEFSTIAWQAMRSAVGNERRKQERSIKTVSLDEVIPNTEGLLLGDTITENNLNYIPYIQEAVQK